MNIFYIIGVIVVVLAISASSVYDNPTQPHPGRGQ
jgi:hypothetical protein